MDNKGFTLVEVLAVIAIIAVVGLIATPSVLSTLKVGKESSDKILYDNISGALQTMYEEVYYSGSEIYSYDKSGKKGSKVVISGSNTVTTNIQTLVGNGFLTGVNNEDVPNSCPLDGSVNCNTKIVLNSEKVDIGMCEIKITKIKPENKICYKVEGISGDDWCPTTDDFGGDSQCS